MFSQAGRKAARLDWAWNLAEKPNKHSALLSKKTTNLIPINTLTAILNPQKHSHAIALLIQKISKNIYNFNAVS